MPLFGAARISPATAPRERRGHEGCGHQGAHDAARRQVGARDQPAIGAATRQQMTPTEIEMITVTLSGVEQVGVG